MNEEFRMKNEESQAMKARLIVPLAATLLLAAINSQFSTAHAQGSLAPPGPPAPTMKSLDQIEARTLISSAPFTITNSGSYYLTTNLIGVAYYNGINIAANNVTLDLNGFALIGATNSSHGIVISGNWQTNVYIRNGAIQGWYNGIDATIVMGGVIEKIRANNNKTCGIAVGTGFMVQDCLASNNKYGIVVTGSCVARNNSCIGNTNFGIWVSGSHNLIDNNNVVTPSGIAGMGTSYASDTNNVIIRNNVSGNGANDFSIVNITANTVGPLITNTVSGIITNSNPWANFSF